MLSNTLNTNEVKNAAGTEVEFEHLDMVGRNREFKQITETPDLRHRLRISHTESGSGLTAKRSSRVGFYKDVAGKSGATVRIEIYTVARIPTGELANWDEVKNVAAELNSFCATTGAGTTVLFDGSGNGTNCLINGGL